MRVDSLRAGHLAQRPVQGMRRALQLQMRPDDTRRPRIAGDAGGGRRERKSEAARQKVGPPLHRGLRDTDRAPTASEDAGMKFEPPLGTLPCSSLPIVRPHVTGGGNGIDQAPYTVCTIYVNVSKRCHTERTNRRMPSWLTLQNGFPVAMPRRVRKK